MQGPEPALPAVVRMDGCHTEASAGERGERDRNESVMDERGGRGEGGPENW